MSRPPLASNIELLLRSYRQLLEARFGERLLWMRLFGSQARGDADAESDVDVAVVIGGLSDTERSDVVYLAFDAWRSQGANVPLIQPLVWSEAEYRDRLRTERRIALDIAHEGISV